MAPTSDADQSLTAALALMRGRRSVRAFRDRPVSDELVASVLDAARWAPSAGNRQAWRLLLVSDPARIGALAGLVADHLATARRAAGWRGGAAGEAYIENFVHFACAPRLVVPVYRVGADLLARMGPGLQRPGVAPGAAAAVPGPVLDAVSSVAAATLQILLAAHAAGLATCWMTGPLVAAAGLRAALDVPEGWHVASLVPLGWPDETPEAPARRPLEDLLLRR